MELLLFVTVKDPDPLFTVTGVPKLLGLLSITDSPTLPVLVLVSPSIVTADEVWPAGTLDIVHEPIK